MKVYTHTSQRDGKIHTIITELDDVRVDRFAWKCAEWAYPARVKYRGGKIHIQGNVMKKLKPFIAQFNKELDAHRKYIEREERKRAAKEYIDACSAFASIFPKKSDGASTWNRIMNRIIDPDQ